MNRYVVEFSKDGYIRYTSHLDLLRLFKRAFKKTGVEPDYSHGFNPHPKMSFTQPLSLGYSSKCESIEFDTAGDFTTEEIVRKLSSVMPKGLTITGCFTRDIKAKPLAAEVEAAVYAVHFSTTPYEDKFVKLTSDYLAQPQIIAAKRQKKTKKMADVDIKAKIRGIEALNDHGMLVLRMTLDCGSTSNLSPEQVISSYISFCGLDVKRWDVDVTREKMIFINK
jgi:radical SAM-linked protein